MIPNTLIWAHFEIDGLVAQIYNNVKEEIFVSICVYFMG